MTIPVEWVKHARELQPAPFLGDKPGIPVIRVDALRKWLNLAEDDLQNGLSSEASFGYRQALNDLLAQLPEGESSPSIGR